MSTGHDAWGWMVWASGALLTAGMGCAGGAGRDSGSAGGDVGAALDTAGTAGTGDDTSDSVPTDDPEATEATEATGPTTDEEGGTAGSDSEPETGAPDPCSAITCQPGWQCNPATQLCDPIPAACDVVGQDCPAGEKCTLAGSGSEVQCVASGAAAIGAKCGAAGGDECTPGGICVGPSATDLTCLRICVLATGAGCPPSELCAGLQGIDDYGVCIQAPPGCDPAAQDCGPGQKCTVVSYANDAGCVADGDKPVGAACGGAGGDDCVAGGICLGSGTDYQCGALCGSPAQCSPSESCHEFEGAAFGHCMGAH